MGGSDLKTRMILPVNAEDRYISVREAAKIIGVSISTLIRFKETDDDFIPWHRTKGNHRRYRLSDVVLFKRRRDTNKKKIIVQEFPIEFEEDFGNITNDRQYKVVMRETKVFQVLIENNMDKPMILILVLGWLLSMVVKLTDHLGLSELHRSADTLYLDYIGAVKKFEDNLELKELEIMGKKEVNPDKRVRYQSSRWEDTKKRASHIFHLLVKASYDKGIDEEERNRAKKICDKILSPFSALSGFLADYHAGTLKHDIAKLLLCKSPKDFGYLRDNWSIRLLSRVCTLDLNTKSASKSQVGRLIKDIKWNCSPNRKLHSPDEEYGPIIKSIAKTMNTMGTEDMILFGDEFKYTSSKINSRLEAKYLPNGLQNIFSQDNLLFESSRGYKPSTSIQITGLYNPITKKLGINEIMKTNFENFYSGLVSLLEHFCKIKSGKIYLILDNAGYHGKKDLQEKLNHKYDNRFEIIWLPVYSPNNNPIEKIWDVLLSAVDRECNNEIDLRKSLKLSIEDYSKNKSESRGYHSLTCFVCDKKWEFKLENRIKNGDSIEKHLCFSLPDLNPFAIHSLTHSQEEFYMGQYV